MNKQTWMPVGEAVRLFAKTPLIRMYKERSAWQRRQNQNHTTAAIYNTGRTLHVDPYGCIATTYYGYEWRWIKYLDFRNPSRAIISTRMHFGKILDTVVLKHEGHQYISPKSDTAVAAVRVRSDSILRRFDIPPMCILYLSVHWGNVKDSLLVYQPLPRQLFPVTEEFRAQSMP
jgi:hypothetical protein